MIALVEPWLLPEDSLSLLDFNWSHRTNCSGRNRNSEGAVLMKKSSVQQDITPILLVESANNAHCLFLQWVVSGVTVIMVYKHPSYSQSRFLAKLEEILDNLNRNILLFGDANMDISNPENRKFLQLMARKDLISKLAIQDPSTDYGTHIDVCFSNVESVDAWFYESYFSYHKAICIVWPKL